MSAAGGRLGVDFGTSNTVAALLGPDGRVRPLLFDGSPLLASAVFAEPGGGVLVGADALRAAFGHPAGLEPYPKRRIDDGTVWLGERELPVVDLVAAVLSRVAAEAARVAGPAAAPEAVLTHPATWGSTRRSLLADAAHRAGFARVRLVAEPVAAAAYFTGVLGEQIPPGRCVVVYDLGAGTFDCSVVRPYPDRFEVVATGGLPDVGGLDLDAEVVRHARAYTAGATAAWQRLDWPQTRADQQARHTLWQAARAVKEQMSRHATAEIYLPLVDRPVHLTREEFTASAGPHLQRTATFTQRLLAEAGVRPEQVAGVFLVGGSSRIPLAATLLHRTLRVAPTVLDQPELVVAEGALDIRHLTTPPAAAGPTHAAAQAPVTTRPAPAGPTPVRAQAPAAPAPASRPAVGTVGASDDGVPATPGPAAAPAPVEVPDTPTRSRPAVPRPDFVADQPPPAGGNAPGSDAAGAPAVRAAAPSRFAATRRRARRPLTTVVAACLVLAAAAVPAVSPGRGTPGAGQPTAPTGQPATTRGQPTAAVVVRPTPTGEPFATFTGHTQFVSAVAFSPDGATLASASADDTVRLWDVARRESVATFPVDWYVLGVAFSVDGATVASASYDGIVRLWDVAGRRHRGALRGHTKPANAVAFSPNGVTLASASDDRTVRLWDVARRRHVATLTGHNWYVIALAFSPDGKLLATASSDQTVRLWDVASRRHLATFGGHVDTARDVAFSPDGKLLATASDDKTVRLWDVGRRRHVATLKGHTGVVSEVVFSPDGRTLATSGIDGTVRLWDVARRRQVAALRHGPDAVYGLAFSSDGTTLATANGDSTVRLWHVPSR
ncbi:Hsp70 family protein [Phytohabitans houttuyneae]|nr:Hsp70 family protein [Phytohabitans houttuyneae]